MNFADFLKTTKQSIQTEHALAPMEDVKKRLIDREIQRRAGMLDQLLTLAEKTQEEAEKNSKKIDGEITKYDIHGEKTQGGYTKSQLDSINKFKNKLEDIDKAFSAAIGETPDYAPTEKILNKYK